VKRKKAMAEADPAKKKSLLHQGIEELQEALKIMRFMKYWENRNLPPIITTKRWR